MNKRYLFFIITISLVGGLLVGSIRAQDATPTATAESENPAPDTQAAENAPDVGRPSSDIDTTSGLPQAFTAYACTFNRNDNRAQIQTIFMNANGRRVPRGDFRSITVVQTDSGDVVASRDVSITPLVTRLPMRMMLVLDITETIPLLEIKQAIIDSLIPNLLPEDEIAVITFGSGVSDPSPFFSDKNRLINEFILDLDVQRGNNRVYDALLQSVNILENFTSSERRTILMITDSGQRVDEQASVDEIIQRSQASAIQIYPIGFYTRDRPDINILRRIAYESNGFGWFYEDEENSRASIQSNVATFLEDFTDALNSELRVDIDTPIPSAEISGLARYRLSVVQSGAQGFETTINCPVDELSHAISFAGDSFSYVTKDPVRLEVNVESDLNDDAVRVRFFVDNRPVQTDFNRSFVFQTSRQTPGQHEIRAQLLDRNDTVLATTVNSVTVYAQQTLDVSVTSGTFEDLARAIGLNVVVGTNINIDTILVNLYKPDSNEPRELRQSSIENGRAGVTLANLQADIQDFSPNAQTGDVFQLRIEVPGASPSDPPLADPYIIPVTYIAPDIPVVAQPVPRWVQLSLNIRREPFLLVSLISLGLFVLNILLFRLVRRLRVQKVIARPDDVELSEALMSVTVHSDDEKKTHPLTKKTLFVGRGELNDIILGTSETISRRHGVIMWRKGRWWYTNRKSDVSAVVEGKRIRGMRIVALEPITEIEFGKDTVMIFHYGSQQNIESLFNTDLGE
ncbi:MAG: FHA domain-containing protein [Anaerolineae bacterium]|nr:FHA domain-containing protein [Anaerolineae bacterium]